MIPIAGRPLLEHQIELARHHGFTRIAIFACYRADMIQNHFGDGCKWGVQLHYIVEREPLGTAGAVCAQLAALDDRFVVMYGDTMFNVNLRRFWQAHEKAQRRRHAVAASEQSSARFRSGGDGRKRAHHRVSQPPA